MLVVTSEVHNDMVAHALASLPNEASGLFADNGGVIDRFVAIANAAASSTRFVLDPQQMLDAEAAIHASGRTVAGVMHSHVDTSAYPSPTDVADAERYDPDATLLHMIVSLRQPEPAMRCFSLSAGTVTELRIDIATDDPVADDGAGPVAAVARLPVRRD